MNKRTLPLCVAGAFGLLLTSCQTQPEVHSTVTTTPRTQPRPLFIARPGQEAIAVSADTNAAFDQAVASYANQGGSARPVTGLGTAPAGSGNDVISDALSATTPLTAPGNTPAPRPGNSSGYITQPGMNSLSSDAGNTSRPSQPDPYQQQPATAPTAAPATPPPAPPVSTPAQPSGSVNYSVQVINTTDGRLFIEASDAAGEVYPCGFMVSGQNYTTNKKQASPIAWPITVVVRDPDRPGTPEIRRYRVPAPTEDYSGKNIGICIVKGGTFYASLDGRVYYAATAD